jgi:ubiquinol-cytochrome c reductase cytochrome c1 subunit
VSLFTPIEPNFNYGMTMIKKLIGALALIIAATGALANTGGHPLVQAPDRINDLAALQNGAKLFVNYCLNCHSASSMRYNKLKDIGLTDEQIKKSLLFTGDKVGDLMHGSISAKDGKAWFGAQPPDLSVMARAKSVNAGPSGSDYIYTYLRTFYRDTSRPTGWNNLAYPNVGMPHVLWDRQGPREMTIVAMHEHAAEGHGKAAHSSWQRITTSYDTMGYQTITTEDVPNYHGGVTSDVKFKPLDPARAAAFDSEVADITAFMTWMSEPVQQTRKRIGVWVLLFLGIFFIVAWRLNASFWKHVK